MHLALAGQHGVSLSLSHSPQLVPLGSWQTPSKLLFLLCFCDHLLVRLIMCCHLQTCFSGSGLLASNRWSYAQLCQSEGSQVSLGEQAGWSMALEETVIMIFEKKTAWPCGSVVYVIPKLLPLFLHLSFAMKDFLRFLALPILFDPRDRISSCLSIDPSFSHIFSLATRANEMENLNTHLCI